MQERLPHAAEKAEEKERRLSSERTQDRDMMCEQQHELQLMTEQQCLRE